jgi:hypothetical protein
MAAFDALKKKRLHAVVGSSWTTDGEADGTVDVLCKFSKQLFEQVV